MEKFEDIDKNIEKTNKTILQMKAQFAKEIKDLQKQTQVHEKKHVKLHKQTTFIIEEEKVVDKVNDAVENLIVVK